MEPTNHAVQIDLSKIVEGENALICTLCNQPLILLYSAGNGFSLRDEDANNPAMGEIAISYSGNPPQA